MSLKGLALTDGPDSYGYSFTDSTEADGPAYSWINIAPTGLELMDSGDDVGVSVELGFPMTFYGVRVDSVVVSSNGYLSTNPDEKGLDSTNDCPISDYSDDTKGARILPFHDDLTLDSSSAAVYYQYFKSSPHPHSGLGVSVFSWVNMRFDRGSVHRIDFQVLVFDNGDILFQYDTPTGVSLGSTVSTGLLDIAEKDALTYQCDNKDDLLTDNLAVLFSPPTLVVDTRLDQLDIPTGPERSLREALRDIPNGGKIVLDRASFSENAVIPINTYGPFDIPDDRTVFIDGNLKTTDDCEKTAVDATSSLRHFTVGSGAVLVLENLAMIGADTISNGGGISTDEDATLRIHACAFQNNQALSGAAIYLDEGSSACISSSVFHQNQSSIDGAAIMTYDGSIDILNSTFYDNCGGNGGAVGGTNVAVTNSTFAHNYAAGSGGAIAIFPLAAGSSLDIAHSTIVNNGAGSGPALQFGVHSGIDGAMTVFHTIIAGNYESDGNLSNVGIASSGTNSMTSLGYNILDSAPSQFTHPDDQTLTDPLLGPLGMYGGCVPTCLPLVGSPAIEQGQFIISSPPGLPGDARGFARTADGDNSGIGIIDVGAVEVGEYLEVTTAVDELNTPASGGNGISLREALRDVDSANGQHIRFAPGMSGSTIDVASLGQIVTDKPTIIMDATSLANPVTLDGDGSTIILEANASEPQSLAVLGVNFTKGYTSLSSGGTAISADPNTALTLGWCQFEDHEAASGKGGAVLCESALLFVDSCVFSENLADRGGALAMLGAPLAGSTRITRSYFHENSGFTNGGAIYFGLRNPVLIDSCTFAENFCNLDAGAIALEKSTSGAIIRNSTFSENLALNAGGAIQFRTFVREQRVTHCTFVANSANAAPCLDLQAFTQVELDHNLFYRNFDFSAAIPQLALFEKNPTNVSLISRGYNLSDTAHPDLDDSDDITLPGADFHLSPFSWNGGPTPTYHPLVKSPALDAGNSSLGAGKSAFDARGLPRFQDGDADSSDALDIGAVEARTPFVVDDNSDLPTTGTGFRYAVLNSPDGGRIIFDPNMVNTTSNMSPGADDGQNTQIVIDKSLFIDATGLPGGFQLVGPEKERILNVIGEETQVAMHAMTIAAGNATAADVSMQDGGGIRVADARLTLSQCAIRDCNAIDDGGGMLLNNAHVLLENTSIFRNDAAGAGGAFFAWNGSTVDIRHCTLVKNESTSGGAGIHNTGSSVSLFSSVVAENFRPNGTDLANHNGDTVKSQGRNLTDGNFISGTSDITGTAAGLGSIVSVGLSWSYTPASGSPMVDNGPPVTITLPLQDGLGNPRALMAKVDIGAFELGSLILDSDKDGMDRFWEDYWGFSDSNSSDAGENPDFDGEDNLGEFEGLTDPFTIDVIAPPVITHLNYDPVGQEIDLTFRSAPGILYSLRGVSDLGNLPTPNYQSGLLGAAAATETSLTLTPGDFGAVNPGDLLPETFFFYVKQN